MLVPIWQTTAYGRDTPRISIAGEGTRWSALRSPRLRQRDAWRGWQGWLEFVPLAGGPPLESARETTQPNRVYTEYWATGLTPVYLEGALKRTLTRPPVVAADPPQRSVFAGPAAATANRPAPVPSASILNPFSVYTKGEALLRRQLAALSARHLVNIAIEYELCDESVAQLNSLPPASLIELIVKGTRDELSRQR